MYCLNKFSSVIFELRKERGWTQTALAEKLRIAPQSISKWERGLGYPDVTLFPLIAEVFGVDIGVLFGRGEEVLQQDDDIKLVLATSQLINRLKDAGVSFADGLNESEIRKIEGVFGFRFPKEIECFFSLAYPLDQHFFDYRDTSEENVEAFHDFQKRIKESFVFDINNNTPTIQALLRPLRWAYPQSFQDVVMDALDKSPRLIPFYSHRCFFDGIDGLPIISFCQPIDMVIYGSDLENYLENEFLRSEFRNTHHIGKISDKMKETGIWYHLVS